MTQKKIIIWSLLIGLILNFSLFFLYGHNISYGTCDDSPGYSSYCGLPFARASLPFGIILDRPLVILGSDNSLIEIFDGSYVFTVFMAIDFLFWLFSAFVLLNLVFNGFKASKLKILVISIISSFLLTTYLAVLNTKIFSCNWNCSVAGGWPINQVSEYKTWDKLDASSFDLLSYNAQYAFIVNLFIWFIVVWLILFAFDKFRNKENNLIKNN